METVIQFFIPGAPITKKNSMQIVRRGSHAGLMPSKQYREYEQQSLWYIPHLEAPIDYPVNIRCVYQMPTRRKVDITNLLGATDDVLVLAGLLLDDNRDIVAGHDGSRVQHAKKGTQPGVEVTITKLEEPYERWK